MGHRLTAVAGLWLLLVTLDGCMWRVVHAKSTGGGGGTGTPSWAPASFDCGVRRAAWAYGQATLPERGSFRTLFDAMQLGTLCGDTPPAELDKWSPPTFPTPDKAVVYCDAAATAGSGDGSFSRPFPSVAQAILAAAGIPGATIMIRGGVYYEHMMTLGPEHSGLTIQNYHGEHAVISGAVPLARAGHGHQPQWTHADLDASSPVAAAVPIAIPTVADWTLWPEVNNVFARAPNPNGDDPTTGVRFLGTFSTIEECANMAASNRTVQSFTWFHPRYSQPPYASHCYGTTTSHWETKYLQPWVVSGRHGGPPAPPRPPWPPTPSPSPPPGPPSPPAPSRADVWALDLSGSTAAHELVEFLGLRLNGLRQIRAKYPNGDPEISGAEGWITRPTEWLKPADKFADGTDKWAAAVDIVTNASQWPGVHWPMASDLGDCRALGEDGAAGCGNFHIGSGGFCSDLDPPVGYWCSQAPPRGQAYNHTTRDTCGGKFKSCGGTQMHMSPAGVRYSAGEVLPNAPRYRNATGAMVQAWRGKQAWYTNGCIVKSQDNDSLYFDPAVGCNQGGEGMVLFGDWWIENVLEELDAAREWWYNHSSKVLYYIPNSTATSEPPPAAMHFSATRTKVLFNVTGTSAIPVVNLTIRGLEIRDTALTYYGSDKASRHSMPTGGDWALERAGAVLLEGTELVTVSHCLFERLDGNGIFLSNFNRNASLARNEFAWIGGSAMAAWGSTGKCLDAQCMHMLEWGVGPDARGGQQPRYTRVVGNLVHEIGLIQKQSSAWFQAATAFTHLEGNVHFNGPRAGVNFNDWMVGGDVLEGNLLANCVRESGDHGPWNSWDRVPYISDVGMILDPAAPVGDHRPDHPGHTLANATHPTVTPLFRQVRNNFILGTYDTLFTLDTDDGSGYLQAHNNFLVYGGGGLKSFFGGRWQHHWENVYAYLGGSGCYWTGVNIAFFDNYCVAQVPFPARLNSSMDNVGCPRNDSYFGATMTVYNNTILTPNAQRPICRGVAGGYPPDTELLRRGALATAPYPRPAPER